MRARSSWLLGGAILLAPTAAVGQSGGVELALSPGFTLATPGSRFKGTDPGYVIEGSIGVRTSKSWQVGAGAEWGTFGADVPEFQVFAPFDHLPWLEYNVIYGYLRRLLAPSARVRPFVEGRVGWSRELAELSGAKIHRAGLATGVSAGLSWGVSSRLSLVLSGALATASYGDARFEGFSADAPGSRATYPKLSGGFTVRLGGAAQRSSG